MYVSRMSFYTRPGHTEQVAQRLCKLAEMIEHNGTRRPRVLRVSFSSSGAPDLQLEQEWDSLADLERGIHGVIDKDEFRAWSAETSELLLQVPKREVLMIEG